METIKWCLSIKNGIKLVEPDDNLSKAYLIKSENALRAASILTDNQEWEISSSYYTMYFALYAILIKLGIKCENHSCTLEFMKRFLMDYFNKEDLKLIKNAMGLRIDAQYYSDKKISQKKYKETIMKAPAFLVKCKEILIKLKEDDIRDVRKGVRAML